MFSVVFPGQGSQVVGMGKEFYEKYDSVKDYFKEADDALNFKLSELVLNGPKSDLDLTANTQPAIFLISYSIFNIVKNEFGKDLNKGKFFAGHSLGEYSALACAGYLNFKDTIKILKQRGEAMQNAVPKGLGGMLAVLGRSIEDIEDLLNENNSKISAEIANDNSEGQIVISGKIDDINQLADILKSKNIKNIKLPVSAPFHCKLMQKATESMQDKINQLKINDGYNSLISNVTAEEVKNNKEIKDLLIKQIESRVRWRESVLNMLNCGVDQFIEIGPGKVLTGLIKRIKKDIKLISINSEEDINNIDIK
tara:strand:+ start:1621 stop:2550 length:930 start_codon:yes stop_codon:yes gene_type:complete